MEGAGLPAPNSGFNAKAPGREDLKISFASLRLCVKYLGPARRRSATEPCVDRRSNGFGGLVVEWPRSCTVAAYRNPAHVEQVGQKVLYWFVIIPQEKLEVGFDNEADFLKYIREYGIEEPTWEDPESIFQRFKDTGCLEWIPDCK
jgi:hypothetical protein